MDLLLDTHIAVWAFNDDSRLSAKARSFINDPDNVIHYSAVSMWEVAIKHALHPDSMNISGTEFESMGKRAGYVMLPMLPAHVRAMETLKRDDSQPRHKDPFDRLLIAQAKSEGLLLITHDLLLAGYNEPCVCNV